MFLHIKIDRIISYAFISSITLQIGLAFGSRIGPIILFTTLSFLAVIVFFKEVELSVKQKILISILIFHSLIYGINSFEIEGFLRVLNCAAICYLVSVIFNRFDDKKVYTYFFLMSVLFLAIELFLRLPSLNPVVVYNTILYNLHILKFGSPFFSDSNGIGIYALCVYMFLSFTDSNKVQFKTILQLLLILFILLSLSRSCILGLGVFLFYSIIYKNSNKYQKYILVCFCLLFLLTIFPKIIDELQMDNSSNDRLLVFKDLYYSIGDDGLFKLLFGYGENIGKVHFTFQEGHYAHAFIPLVLGQSGLLCLLSFLFLFVIVSIDNERIFIFVVTFNIIGLIFMPPYFEMVYVVLSGLLSLEYTEKRAI
ncbi:hypothetical protein AB4302_06295 [Vibrio breoganii]